MKIDEREMIHQYSQANKSLLIDTSLYQKYNVQRGLRDINGKGVLAGLTHISNVMAARIDEDGNSVPCPGSLRYRGVDIKEIAGGLQKENRFGFEGVMYLLLFGKLPNKTELKAFISLLSKYRNLPDSFIGDIIIRTPCKDMMNTLQRGVLTLYTYDDNADDISNENILRQCLQLIAKMPLIAVYGYQSYSHHFGNNSLIIHSPLPNLSTAENLLRLLRADSSYTPLEAHVLDLALILHAEHGGGNNSTFTDRVVSSSGTDTYSAIAASLSSLKGPRHGGANIKVVKMFDDMKSTLRDPSNERLVEKYLNNLLDKKAFDNAGLIYGFGHAVYSYSDPRAEVLREYARKLCEEKGMQDDFNLYETVARLAPKVIGEKRKIYKGVCPNVDFYSGLIYKILDIPYELYTPLFAIARIVGWSAHRLEELNNDSKIIRPAYKSIAPSMPYIPMDERE